MANKVYDNEKWWQDNGIEWVREIEKRRNTQPLYGVQEVVLSEYFSQLPSSIKVMEFGAGFGRHAKYLAELKNIEYYAVDQSPTMLDAFKSYTEGKIAQENIILIEPRQRLPFPDNYFDVVFTVSVLIHINPEHIQGIVDELKRVAKHVVFHFENKLTDTSALQFKDHNGCWKHAVQNLYEKVEVINDLTEEQTLYFAYKSNDEAYKFKINPVMRERLFTMDECLGYGLKELEGEVGWRQKELEAKDEKLKVLEGEVGWRQKELETKDEQVKVLAGEVGWRQKELEGKDEKLKVLEGEVGWRQEELEHRETQVKELEGQVGWRQQELEHRETQIKELEGQVGWRQQELEHRETQVKELQGEVGWRQQELEHKEAELRELEGEVGWRQQELEHRETQINDLEEQFKLQQKKLEDRDEEIKVLEEDNEEYRRIQKRNKEVLDQNKVEIQNLNNELQIIRTQLEATNNELSTIYGSNSWKVIQRLKGIVWLNKIAKKLINLYRKLKEKNITVVNQEVTQEFPQHDPISEAFLEHLAEQENQEVLAITHKHWMGVQNSTKELFKVCVVLEELNSYSQVITIGNAIIDRKIKKLVLSGFAAGWNTLCSYVKEKAPEIKIIIFWHGSTTHMYEDYSWVRYQEILQLSKDGHIDKLAFAKESMCPVYKKLGINVGLIKNHVERTSIPNTSELSQREHLRIGIYSSGGTWNKNAYTQIAAASLFDGATVSLVPYNDRMHAFATQLGLQVEGSQGNMSREELNQEFRKNDINFYVTFSECAPLIPLESLNNGVVCLTGNNHHYFSGSKLEELLIVDRPDDAVAIYNQAVKALEHKEEILALYDEWYEVNKREARQSIMDL